MAFPHKRISPLQLLPLMPEAAAAPSWLRIDSSSTIWSGSQSIQSIDISGNAVAAPGPTSTGICFSSKLPVKESHVSGQLPNSGESSISDVVAFVSTVREKSPALDVYSTKAAWRIASKTRESSNRRTHANIVMSHSCLGVAKILHNLSCKETYSNVAPASISVSSLTPGV